MQKTDLLDFFAVAGLIELLRTQGLWGASFRLAYQQVVARGFVEALADGGPQTEELHHMLRDGQDSWPDLEAGLPQSYPPPAPQILQATVNR